MKTLIASLTAALVLLGLAAGGASAKKAAPACAKEGKTVLSTKTVRIYSTTAKVEGEEYVGSIVEPRTYGCLLATGDRLRLDYRCMPDDVDNDEYAECLDRPSKFAVSGRYVAVVLWTQDEPREEQYFDSIVFARLGRAADIRPVFDYGELTRVDRLLISPSGALAFSARIILEEDDELDPYIGYVAPLRTGRALIKKKLSGSSTTASTRSLRASGGKITWTDDGKLRSAPFK